MQGGPLMHVIAAKAVCFGEALQPEFKEYQHADRRQRQGAGETLAADGFRIVSGGTDNHLMLVDVSAKGMTGERGRERAGRGRHHGQQEHDPVRQRNRR